MRFASSLMRRRGNFSADYQVQVIQLWERACVGAGLLANAVVQLEHL